MYSSDNRTFFVVNYSWRSYNIQQLFETNLKIKEKTKHTVTQLWIKRSTKKDWYS